MIIILEGACCTGKTTTALELTKRLGYSYRHFPSDGYYGALFRQNGDQEMARQDILTTAIPDNTVVDRHWTSHRVYRELERIPPVPVSESTLSGAIEITLCSDKIIKRRKEGEKICAYTDNNWDMIESRINEERELFRKHGRNHLVIDGMNTSEIVDAIIAVLHEYV